MQNLKKVSSYLTDQKVDAAFSKISGKLKLIYRNGKLQLQTENAVYSYEDLYSVFARGFKQIKIEKRKIENVLILGFGLGSVPIILEKNYKLNANYLGVEIDEIIANWNQKYLPENILEKCKIEIADAHDFTFQLKENQNFDLIIVDIFIDNFTPPKFRKVQFLEKLKTHLNKKGTLLYNTLAYKQDLKDTSNQFYDTVFKNVFNNSFNHKVLENNLLEGKL